MTFRKLHPEKFHLTETGIAPGKICLLLVPSKNEVASFQTSNIYNGFITEKARMS